MERVSIEPLLDIVRISRRGIKHFLGFKKAAHRAMENVKTVPRQIKPHYRSEGPRQGSCGLFLGGCVTLSANFLLYVRIPCD